MSAPPDRTELPTRPQTIGCCTSCGGTGSDNSPDTGGRCWDCMGTGHCHEPDPTCTGPATD